MGELRFILLLAGLLFLAALAAWELRKPRQAQGDAALRDTGNAAPSRRTEPQIGSMGDAPAEAAEGRRRMTAPPHIDRPELPDLPAMEAMRAEFILADADVRHAEELADEPSAELAPPAHEAVPESQPSTDTTASAAAATAAAAARPATLSERVAADITVPTASAKELPLPGTQPVVLDWPPEGERHIIALRIVPPANERLSGRAVRLAITACGFVHGRFGIYHQPDGEGRALLSVASLSKPGVLDPINMDFQRLSGINLFAVLPGPLSPGAALDHLLDTARELSQRLPARVQDETGHPLDAERLEDLRERMQNLA